MSHRLVIQLARLGDLLQTLPVIASLQAHYPDEQFDLLCAKPLVSVGSFFPDIRQVFPWDGDEWSQISQSWSQQSKKALSRAADCVERFGPTPYDVAYNLNNHPRAIFAAHLLANAVRGSGCDGALSPTVPNWMQYLKIVGVHRGGNRVHLTDAFCGICGVRPLTSIPLLEKSQVELPRHLEKFCQEKGQKIALVLGAGDSERRIPLFVWREWIETYLAACSDGCIVLIGGEGEQALVHTLLDQLSPLFLGRVWDGCGRTGFPQLIHLFQQCQWVVGSDTGPLHLAVACGTRVMGLYFARARVHETGPNGEGHWVWQAVKRDVPKADCTVQEEKAGTIPINWPISESIELLLTDSCAFIPDGWSVWESHHDHHGAYYTELGQSVVAPPTREYVWQLLEKSEIVDWNIIMDVFKEQELISSVDNFI